MVFIPVDNDNASGTQCNSTADCMFYQYCGYDPTDIAEKNDTYRFIYENMGQNGKPIRYKEIGQICVDSLFGYAVTTIIVVVFLCVIALGFRRFCSKRWAKRMVANDELLLKAFTTQMTDERWMTSSGNTKQADRYVLRLSPNSVPLIMQLFRIGQVLTGIYYVTELVHTTLNSPATIAIVIFMAPLFTGVMEFHKPNVDNLVKDIKRVLPKEYYTEEHDYKEDKEMSNEEILFFAYLVEVDSTHVGSTLSYPWDTTWYFFGSSLICVFSGGIPWVMLRWHQHVDRIPDNINWQIYWFAIFVALFNSLLMAVLLFIRSLLGLQVFVVDGNKQDIYPFYGHLNTFLNLAGYHCTIRISKNVSDERRVASIDGDGMSMRELRSARQEV